MMNHNNLAKENVIPEAPPVIDEEQVVMTPATLEATTTTPSTTTSLVMIPEAPGGNDNNNNPADVDGTTQTMNNVRRTRGSDRDSLRSSINMLEPPPPPPEKEEIAQGASRAVLLLRIAVLLVLLASTIALCVLIANFLKDSQQKEFENQFQSDATKVMDTVGKNMADTLETTDAVIQELVVYAHYANMTWPFVTMPGFAQTVLKALKVTKGLNIVIYPKVEHSQQPEWEEYAAYNGRQWVDEGFDVMEKDTDWKLPINRTYDVSPTLYGLEGPYPPYEPNRTDYINPFYTPAWQNAPSAPKALVGYPYNYDFMVNSIYSDALLDYAIPQQSVVMYPEFSGIVYNETDEWQIFLANVYWDFARQFLQPDENEKEPFLTCILPIFAAAWDSVRVDRVNKTPEENDFVGSLVSSFYVRDFLRNLLPERSRGILTSFENCRNEIFTYEINGDTPTFVGVGKNSNWEKYHTDEGGNMAVIATLGELVQESNDKRKSRYSGLPLSDDPCPFTLHVYPSQEMEDQYITNAPHWYAFIVAMVFVFTSIVFLIYDRLVAKRQKIVMARALASGEIVSDLFPEKVRKQLYQEKAEAQKKREEDKKKATAAADISTALNPLRNSGSLAVFLNQPQNLRSGTSGSKPLADLFHETTIFFADLVGFTSWSAVRTPTEVFQLLEGIFHAFDKIAAKRRVFKVETIGDCYVAVTGIPEPQSDHAVIMCKFANDCINKMHIVVHDLADILGPDTADLDMRVGLHSGSTTAGVLRGEKGRFQLFGDTVNTASRMESNGVKGRIQVSQATADSLIEKGKEAWLIPRKEKVQAKGKGEMQTYFINVGGATSIISGMSSNTTLDTSFIKEDE